MRRRIRLGVIRADTHGYYYGVMLDACDPLLLQKHNYVCHHYATGIYLPDRIYAPQVPGFEIVRIYDTEHQRAQQFSEVFLGKPVVCDKLEEVCKDVDAVAIYDCDGGGGDHLRLATPSLRQGIPTFVDKPFASTLADAQEIVRLARRHRTPLFNASILSYVPAAAQFKARFDEIRTGYYPLPNGQSSAPIGLGVVKGVGGAFSQELSGQAVNGGIEQRLAYLIHGVALALNLFGTGVEWVETMGTLPLEYVHLHLESGVEVMILNTHADMFPELCSFYASAYSKFGAVHSNAIGDPEFLGGGQRIMEVFRDMVRSGKPPVAYESFLEHIAVIEAAHLAQQKGQRVSMKDVWQR
jgi:hypothetical protein